MNFEKLKQELSSELLDDSKERYEFTWPDKRKAILNAITPTNKTLRPSREESKDFDTTQNLYIEGDNLEVLKLLQKTYLGKVKMIYIDPPYNTGNDFIYQDNFKQSQDEYNEQSSDYDDDGNRLVSNPSSNGRFHTDWLNMIYPRLKLARDLLTDDGVIFISIDDNEQANLKKVCDEIFGEGNFVASIIWKRKRGRDNSARWFSKAHEYCLLYAKEKDNFDTNFLELDEETVRAYKNPDNDPRGNYRMLGCWARGTQGGVRYSFTSKDGQFFKERLWLFSKENLAKLDTEDKLIFRGDNIYRKMFIFENKGKIPETLWDNVSNAANASDEIKMVFSDIVFDTPKPTPYILRMIEIACDRDATIMDFFSGSATTAHAVMKLNAEDGGHRKFIMVQLPEVCDENSEAAKAGYKNICEIGKERIRRAGQKIKEESPLTTQNLDIGFRVLKLDSSNMKDVFYKPSEVTEDIFDNAINNIKEDRTGEDLLFQVLLDMGISLSSKIEKKKIKNKEVFYVYAEDEKFLIASFDRTLNDEVVTEIAKEKPQYFVMRDTDDDKVRINFEQIFKAYSPDTTRKVL
ncbi:MAG: site-specific DNA-methyltransferase [Bdellovibrionota bacterium]|nr:site-specific DNA-methyltransferase [Bdellovibrionota bacterium]